jgi:aminopeptidase N
MQNHNIYYMKIQSKIVAKFIFVASLFIWQLQVSAQEIYTRQDSLRGSLSTLRTCFDVYHYDLNLRVDVAKKTIAGYNTISYKVVQPFDKLQLDLFENLQIDSIIWNKAQGKERLKFEREGKAFFVFFPITQNINSSISVYYSGKPIISVNPPWDGGFTYKEDKEGKTWIGVSCEGIGASLWYPNKDHLSDEPDSMRIYCEVPDSLVCVANGNLISQRKTKDNFIGFEWKVGYPINNYNVTLNIANYAHLQDFYVSEDKDTLRLDYYVLAANAKKAAKHFKQVQPMLACFEKLFGKYPFWKDGYALVETPYWGMEHQGAIAYGNQYKNNKWGFDYIIVHESGHEYFGNSLSVNDHAEMWIHESFTTYVEALFVEHIYGEKTMIAYLLEQQENIRNTTPMLGHLGVNYDKWDGSDIYYKGTWMLHSLRNTVADDKTWFATIKAFAEKFKISQLSTEQVIDFFNEKTGKNLTPIFKQYLTVAAAPKLVYYLERGKKKTTLYYRWQADEPNFNMPMKIKVGGETQYQTIYPQKDFQKLIFATNETAQNPVFATELFYFELKEGK